MANAKKLPSGQWRALVYDYTDSTGKRYYESFTSDTKKEADYMAAEFALSKQNRSKTTITFGRALDEYIQGRSEVLSPATIRKYKSLRKNVLQGLMDMRIKDITQDSIQHAINKESLTHSPKSVRDIHGLVSSVMRLHAPSLRLNTALPKKIRTDIYIPSDEDIKALMFAVTGTEMEIPVLLAAFGAMRRGEISALDSNHVKGNTIHISQTMVLDEFGKWIVKAPKSYAGDRYVEYPDFVVEKLRGKKGNITDLAPNKITSRFEHILKSNGLPKFRFHDLRHYNASISHALGIPDAYIMQKGGWGSDRVLKDVYRHTMNDTEHKMNTIAIQHFENMQHEMQHEKNKA